jgi:hypothetical protein
MKSKLALAVLFTLAVFFGIQCLLLRSELKLSGIRLENAEAALKSDRATLAETNARVISLAAQIEGQGRQQVPPSPARPTVLVPTELLHHLTFNAIKPDFTLTPQFERASAATAEELSKLNSALQRAGAQLLAMREASTTIVTNDSELANATIAATRQEGDTIRSEMLNEAYNAVDPQVYTIFSSLVEKELGQRFGEYGTESQELTITKFASPTGEKVFWCYRNSLSLVEALGRELKCGMYIRVLSWWRGTRSRNVWALLTEDECRRVVLSIDAPAHGSPF